MIQKLQLGINLLLLLLTIKSTLFSQEIEFSKNLRCSDFNDIQKYPLLRKYAKSLKCYDEYLDSIPSLPIYSKKIQTIDAAEFIYKCVDTVKLLCFNELHHNPSTRIFLYSVLDSLYEKGFRDIAIEGLNKNKLIDINFRNYLSYKDGLNVEEIFFYNLLIKIKELGLTIHYYDAKINWNYFKYNKNGDLLEKKDTINNFYETIEFQNGKPISVRINYNSKREFISASQIMNKILPKVKNKLIIFAGSGHIYEKWNTSMISYLKNLTNINPLTFDLTDLTEHSDIYFEDQIYRMLNIESPSLIVLNDSIYNCNNNTDFCIATPRILNNYSFLNILKNQGRHKYKIPQKYFNKKHKYPIICSIYNKIDSVSIDRVELNNKFCDKTLFIPRGKHKLVFRYYDGFYKEFDIEF